MMKRAAIFSVILLLITGTFVLTGCGDNVGIVEDPYQYDKDPGKEAIKVAEAFRLHVSLPDPETGEIMDGFTVGDFQRLLSYPPREMVQLVDYYSIIEHNHLAPFDVITVSSKLLDLIFEQQGITDYKFYTIPELVFFETPIKSGVSLVYWSDYLRGIRGTVHAIPSGENKLELEPGELSIFDIELVFSPPKDGQGGLKPERFVILDFPESSSDLSDLLSNNLDKEDVNANEDDIFTIKTDEPQIVVPDDYPTIQEAVIAAVNGDTIMVKPGEYIENITIKSKNITLCSQDPYDEDIVSNTIISGGGNGPVITINSGESIIAGFTIKGGTGAKHMYTEREAYITRAPRVGVFGGGILILKDSFPVIANNIIKENIISSANEDFLGCGGGIAAVDYSSPKIIDNVIEYNEADVGGGIYIADDFSPSFTWRANALAGFNSVIKSNTIKNNTAKYGGGIQAVYSTPSILENKIIGNKALIDGGGLNLGGNHSLGDVNFFSYIDGNLSKVFNNLITENRAESGGGAIAAYPGTFASIYYNTIKNNEARFGGGIYSGSMDYEAQHPINNTAFFNIAKNTFESNRSDDGSDDIKIENDSHFIILDKEL